jgi:heme A synthase
MNTMSETTRDSRTDMRHRARHQVMGLSMQFLFGMAIALIGQPSETAGAAHTASNVLLGLHVLVAVVLIAGAARVIRTARGSDRQRRLAHWGAAAIVLTFGTGILTLITMNDWWSYAMAVGFIASLLVYVSLLVQATNAAGRSQEEAATPTVRAL